MERDLGFRANIYPTVILSVACTHLVFQQGKQVWAENHTKTVTLLLITAVPRSVIVHASVSSTILIW